MLAIPERIPGNILEARKVGGKTVVSRALFRPPVRFVQTRGNGSAALVFVTALGGGMLEGDDLHYQVDCGPEAALVLLPQSNTRIFPCPHGRLTRQQTHGVVFANGLVVTGGDPLVLYREAHYSQTQHWVLHPGGRLAIVEWLVAGRLARDERFSFRGCSLETKVWDADGKPILTDRVKLGGEAPNPLNAWGGFAAHFALHVLGPGADAIQADLETWLKDKWNTDGMLAGLGAREGRGFSLRALGMDRMALDPLAARVFAALGRAEWLGFDPWKRKY